MVDVAALTTASASSDSFRVFPVSVVPCPWPLNAAALNEWDDLLDFEACRRRRLVLLADLSRFRNLE
jgi:hypothetical protein